MLNFLKNKNLSLEKFCLLFSGFNFLFFYFGFFHFVFKNIDYTSFNGVLLIFSLLILGVLANFFAFYLLLFIFRIGAKILIGICFILSSIAVYFVNTYNVIIDESMIGNILNTNYEESSSFFSIKFLLYLFFLGILPFISIIKTKIIYPNFKKFIKKLGISLILILFFIGINAKNILWIDKNSKYLGGLAMPWAYAVNTTLFYIHQNQKNQKEIPLPKAQITDKQKSVVVLIIGESARSANFSLYGYPKNTNPLLSTTPNVFHFPAKSCATYTTAGVKCILQHENTSDLYEILPNYLHRNQVEVIWRTTNSGEPPIHISKYQTADEIKKNCQEKNCNYDEILLSGLKEEILKSSKDKILIILHTSTSHGPTYNQKYPSEFEKFSPVCQSVELGNCTQEELINAYDNTIVYTDFLLSKTIKILEELPHFEKTMLYVSDHGESLGENQLYMHGLPIDFAPKEQYEIPFIIWVPENSKKKLKKLNSLGQNYVFHSVLNFLSVKSPIYNENLNIFENNSNPQKK